MFPVLLLQNVVELTDAYDVPATRERDPLMEGRMRYLIAWLLGVPLSVLIVIWLIWGS